MKIIMLGAPGAGKGSRAAIMAEHYKIPHISTGDIFRANLKAGTELGLEAKKYMDAGELVPDELTVKILLDRVSQSDCASGYILDGFPRTINQAEVLEAELAKQSEKIDFAIEVYVPDEMIEERMSGRRVCKACGATYHAANNPPAREGICDKCGGEVIQRADDAIETVRQRLVVYHEQTAPLIDFYAKRGILKWVDGTGSLQTALISAQKVIES
ncbi:MAG: adenylate kinase [Lachnospiraceae bacterium]|jgi:adenylate kinase|nr:adenylate kinase [Lachnospiraceae bacterium]